MIPLSALAETARHVELLHRMKLGDEAEITESWKQGIAAEARRIAPDYEYEAAHRFREFWLGHSKNTWQKVGVVFLWLSAASPIRPATAIG